MSISNITDMLNTAREGKKMFDAKEFSAKVTSVASERRFQRGQRSDNCTCLTVQLKHIDCLNS